MQKTFNPFSGNFDFVGESGGHEHTHPVSEIVGLKTTIDTINGNIDMLADNNGKEYEFAVGNATNAKATQSSNNTTYINLIEHDPRRNIVDLANTRGRVKMTGKNGIEIKSVDNSLTIDAAELKNALAEKITLYDAENCVAELEGVLQPQITQNSGNIANHESRIATLEQATPPEPETPQMLIATTHAELKELRDTGRLIPGVWYRITDYQCTTTQADTMAADHPFDILVLATDNHTLNENARAMHHEGDLYFSQSNLAAWELKYCLDNDTTRFLWADENSSFYKRITVNGITYKYIGYWVVWYDAPYNQCWVNTSYTNVQTVEQAQQLYYVGHPDVMIFLTTNNPSIGDTVAYSNDSNYGILNHTVSDIQEVAPMGRGVIWQMKDEWNNLCPYDFKNILFVKEQTAKYTFDYFNVNTNKHCDFSIKTKELTEFHPVYYKVAYNNSIKPNYVSTCLDDAITYIQVQMLNRITLYAGENTNLNEIANNSFGYNCSFIDCNRSSTYNIFGNGCNNIEIKPFSTRNIFGNNCTNIILDYSNYDNVFGNNCTEIELSYGSNRNVFGDYFRYNQIAGAFSNCVFGKYFEWNNLKKRNTFIGAVSYENCKFGDNINYITIDATGSSGDPVKNLEIESLIANCEFSVPCFSETKIVVKPNNETIINVTPYY